MMDSLPLLSFYGDDFTGSTDAKESLARAGFKTRLFTKPPTREMLASIPDLRAFGVAGRTRSMSPEEMRTTLQHTLTAIRETDVPIVHYKVCSTFDSSPNIGSIGCAIDVGSEVFRQSCVPVVGGAPHLGRYCVFGNLFVKSGSETNAVRLDRYANMRNHPITPMDEADLRLHLSKQTDRRFLLLDTTQINDACGETLGQMTLSLSGRPAGVLIDFHSEDQGVHIAQALYAQAAAQRASHKSLFVVGSSGVEVALAAFWNIGKTNTTIFPSPISNGPLLVAVGSCSPVTSRQIRWANDHGFDAFQLTGDAATDESAIRDALSSLQKRRNVVIHTGGATSAARHSRETDIGGTLAISTRQLLEQSDVKRLLVAGGDTSGQIADTLEIGSLEIVGTLVRGAPLCRATSALSCADGLEVVFKGGQIGGDDFFGLVASGTQHSDNTGTTT